MTVRDRPVWLRLKSTNGSAARTRPSAVAEAEFSGTRRNVLGIA